MTAFGFLATFAGAGVRGVENGCAAEVDVAAGGPSPPGVLDSRGLAWFTLFGLTTAYVRTDKREAGRRAEERRQRAQNMADTKRGQLDDIHESD